VNASAFDLLRLHSAYRDGKFLVWGEVSPRKSSPHHLPFCAKPVRIGRAISQVVDDAELPADFKASTIWLPTIGAKPVGPAERTVEGAFPGIQRCKIQPWTVSTAILSAESTFYFLDACNRNPGAEDRDTRLAPSTRFWGARTSAGSEQFSTAPNLPPSRRQQVQHRRGVDDQAAHDRV
jgi:hypothetical protein